MTSSIFGDILRRAAATGSDPSSSGAGAGGTPPTTPVGGPPVLTPEQIAALPHDTLGPKLNAVVWTLTGVSAIFLALRLYCKTVLSRGLWWDDWILTAAWIAILAESIIISVTVGMGFGHHTWDVPFEDLGPMFKVFSVGGTLSICASVWSKTSFALTILRLTEGWMRKFIWALIISMNVFMGVTGLINYIHCWPLDKLWDFTGAVPGTCWPIEVVVNYDIFSAVYSGVMDIVLALLPWKLLWNLQMQKKEKIGVIFAMSMGVFAGVTSFVKASYLRSIETFDIYDAVDLNYWSNAESTVTIMAASIPILRVLIQDVKKTILSRHHGSSAMMTAGGSDANGSTSFKKSRYMHTSSSQTANNNRTAVRTGTSRSRTSEGTEGSEMNILDKEALAGKGAIVQTSRYSVEFYDSDGKKSGWGRDAV
ncbi:hypothetical protein QBC47DRAFT_443316 [Echria macrotheca]|uniref:Rhodopsin domain-containing protein n=1 Tax=Echria macrotheca TaxID=438768 RepID=A0AAJ0FCP9_9PEZI|nr:hypothetical protein QBC47DRAFT_443316 [Echria macrotheca]